MSSKHAEGPHVEHTVASFVLLGRVSMLVSKTIALNSPRLCCRRCPWISVGRASMLGGAVQDRRYPYFAVDLALCGATNAMDLGS